MKIFIYVTLLIYYELSFLGFFGLGYFGFGATKSLEDSLKQRGRISSYKYQLLCDVNPAGLILFKGKTLFTLRLVSL